MARPPSVFVTIKGKTISLREFAKEVGQPYPTLYRRIVIEKSDPFEAIQPRQRYFENLEGQVFNDWTVIERDPSHPVRKGEPVYYLCRCKCGNIVSVYSGSLNRGLSKGCDDCRGRRISRSKTRHGYGKNTSGVYSVWGHMKQRCYNSNNPAFRDYGGRGITVCERWRNSFENFLADMGEPKAGQTLNRIDNDGPYSPENCEWTNLIKQANNKRNNVKYENQTLAQIARDNVVSYKALWKWVHGRGLSPDEALWMLQRHK